ncbi:MAG: UbiX family flavin prenyltransferase [Firmicutes bacterium]|nr:UbiX family flavin prenyltransferase [Bacillota bacterium]
MRIVVGVTGASGVEMSYYLLKALDMEENCEIHLVISEKAKINWQLETDRLLDDLLSLANVVYGVSDLAAPISSGSYITDGIIIMPCSMKTLAGITAGYADNLIIRAVDVCMKECRKVVLVPREMPFGKVHLRNMKEASDLDCVIIPPVLTFYNGSKTIEDQINHIVGKVLMQFGIEYSKFVSWAGIDE